LVDQKLTELTLVTILANGDLIYTVVDPSGTPLSRAITKGDMMKFTDGAVIYDENGNEILKILKTASAVNEVEIQNGATGQPAVIRASGETNIGLKLTGKGTGKVQIANAADPTKIIDFSVVGATTGKTLTFTAVHTDDRTITLPDATGTLALLGIAQTWAAYQTMTLGTRNTPGTLTYGSTVTVDFDTTEILTVTLTGNIDFNATSNKASGRHKTIRIVGDGSSRTLAFHADWKFVGTKPTSLAANKVAILTLTCFGTNDSDIVAGYAVQT